MKPVRTKLRGRTIRRLFSKLWRASGGTAVIEFAISLPILITLGMFGSEIAYMAVVNLQVSQIALSVADNASRLGQTENSAVAPTITETGVDSVMNGAITQGAMIDLQTNGRVILTSLEYDTGEEKQYIHWQRCVGDLSKTSDYGNDSTHNGLTGTDITGLGSGTQKVSVAENSAVMFVEVFYRHEGLFGTLFINNMEMKREGAFIIRDDRNLAPGVTGAAGTSSCE